MSIQSIVNGEIQAGLNARYYLLSGSVQNLTQINFDVTPAATGVVSSLNHMLTTQAFWTGGATDQFAAVYEGSLNVAKAGSYTFYLTSDDGSALYIDGIKVLDNDGLHGAVEKRATLTLGSGAHDIEIRYFENTGRQTLKFEWAGPDTSGARRLVEADAGTGSGTVVAPPPVLPEPDPSGTGGSTTGNPGLTAEYFALSGNVSALSQVDFSATPTKRDVVREINWATSYNPLWQGGPSDQFAARFSGDVVVERAGSYTFYLTSDDGSALYIDGQVVVNNDGPHGAVEKRATVNLEAGAHEIEVRYFENTGRQTLQLEWKGPDTAGTREVLTGDHLVHDATADIGDGGTGGGSVVDPGTGTGGVVDDHDDGDTGDGSVVDPGTGTGGVVDDHDDGDHSAGGDHDHADHGDDSAISLPTTPAEIEAFVQAVKSAPEAHAHGDNAPMAREHGALLDLVPRADATHVAIANGDWFNASTWYNGRIPGADAKVLIPEGVTVNYDGESDASLFTVRVDGELSFAIDANTKMIVDTMVISSSGRLEIGTADRPIQAGVEAQILIANNGNIDTRWDPTLLSRGVISHGEVEIHGAEKTAFLKVAAAPMAGDREIQLAEVPDGWRVGDTIVVSGTHKEGWTWDNTLKKVVHRESQDEEVTITAITGGKITIDRPLEFDHDTPREDLFAYVANTTRNITFASEDGDATAVHHRGHVMFMHNDEVDVRYAAFDDLGRTDKSEDAFDLAALSTVTAESNIKGRYSLHFHKTGTTDADDPAIALGNTVSGGAGWGFVHHSSNVDFIENVAYDVFGAAFAAEDGDETGIWLRNMAIKVEGIAYGNHNVKDGDDKDRHDNGRTGDGFFFAGRLVEAAENVAINTTHGYVWFHRSAPTAPLAQNLDHPEIAYGSDTIGVNNAPIQGFRDNEAFGTQVGLIVIKSNPAQGHDLRTVMDGFLNWETSQGVDISYTSHYTFIDFDLVGTTNTSAIARADTAFVLGGNAYDMVVNGMDIEGFATGMDLDQRFTFTVADRDIRHVFIDVEMSDVDTKYEGYNSGRHLFLSESQLKDLTLGFKMTGSTVLDLTARNSIVFTGTKTDTIGSTDRQFTQDRQQLDYKEAVRLLQTDGYYTAQDGRKVLIVEDFVTDRATGEVYKFAHVITLKGTDAQLAGLDAINNGSITLGGGSPVARDDSFSTANGQEKQLDVLANDAADGQTLRLDGFSDPGNGDVFQQQDGSLIYRPNHGYTGTDSFDYWATDDVGNYSRATVTVEVWDL
jgi:hypothetical protein